MILSVDLPLRLKQQNQMVLRPLIQSADRPLSPKPQNQMVLRPPDIMAHKKNPKPKRSATRNTYVKPKLTCGRSY